MLNTEEKTWSAEVNPTETGLPDYVENLSILAFLKKNSEYIAASALQVVYGGYENLALGKTATASSMYSSNYGPEKAVDGINSVTTNRWASSTNDAKPYMIVDFGEAVTFNKAIIYEYKGSVSTGLADGYRSTGFTIWYDQGDDNWIAAYTGAQIGAKGEFMFSKPETAKRVKLELTDYPVTGYQPSILEFEIYLVSTDLNIPVINMEKNFFILYPNPVKAGQPFTVETDDKFSDAPVSVYTVGGVKVLEWKMNDIFAGQVIKQKGVYIIKVAENGKKQIGRIVVN